MEHQRLDQVRAVGGVSEGLQPSAICVGASARGRLQEPHVVAEVRRGGDEEQVHQPRAECLGPRCHSIASRRSALVQVHSHGGDAGECGWCAADFREMDDLDAGPAGLVIIH